MKPKTEGGFFSYRSDLKKKARENRKNPSLAENKFWYEILCNQKLNYKFLRQKPIMNFIIDFYCSKLLLAIEIDGDSHSEQEVYDFKRTSLLKGLNIKVIRYSNNDVMENIEGVYEDFSLQLEARKKELNFKTP